MAVSIVNFRLVEQASGYRSGTGTGGEVKYKSVHWYRIRSSVVDAGPGGIILRAPDKLRMLPVQNGLNGANCGGRNQYRGVWGNFSQLGGQVPEDESGLD